MTKLISGRVHKVPSANVSADRREFIELSETEPDLGLPSVAGWVLSSDLTGNRSWIDPVQAAGGTPYFANTSNFAVTSNIANFAYVANVANIVLTLSNFTTANLVEGINLYFTNARVIAALSNATITGNLTVTDTIFANTFTGANGGQPVIASIGSLTLSAGTDGNIVFTSNIIANQITANNFIVNGNASKINGNLTVTDTIFANTFTGANGGQPVIASIGTLTLSAGDNGNIVFTSNIIANQIIVDKITANVWNRLYTANVIETSDNLYFTNARVLANVEQMSINVLADVDITGIATNGILTWNGSKFIAGTIESGAVANIANFSYVANVANTVLTLSNFTTANLIESSSNLYYTNARARTAFTAGTGIIIDWAAGTISANTGGIIVGLTTADVSEVSSNLYFTNARVIAALSNATITGNLTVTDTIFANTFTGANGGQPVIASIGTLTLSAGDNGNIVFTSNIIANKITANNLVINGNELFFGAAGANLTVNQITSDVWNRLYTANVIETSGNLYFTNARARTVFTAADSSIVIDWTAGTISANTGTVTGSILPFLTTANVVETSGNLYYTNARVIAALSNATITGNLTVTDTIFANTFTGANGGQPVIASIGSLTLSAGSEGNIVFTSNIIANQITANNLIINGNASKITGNLTVTDTIFANTFTGANGGQPVIASIGTLTLSAGDNGNIVFTSNIIANQITANNLVINGNELFSGAQGANLTVNQITSDVWNRLYTANVIETSGNLYFTNARANAAIYPSLTAANIANFINTVNATVQPFLTTANVVETSGNLYFTNARVIAALSNATITGNLTVTDTIFANTFTGANGGQPVIASIGTLTLSAGDNGNIVFTSNIVANKITANNFVINGKELFSGDKDANLAVNRITSDVWNRLYTANVIETSGNLYFTVERVNATVQPFLTTANVIETSGNLYFTNARAVSAVTPLLTAANIANFISTVNATVQPFLTTANVIETSANLYFTNARVVSALIAGQNITIESNGRISANITAAINEIANINLTIDNLTTDGITEGATNLYFTNARVLAALVTANVFVENLIANSAVFANAIFLGAVNVTSNIISGSGATFSGDVLTDSVTANIWNRLYTANVIETSGNLYYTNARANAAIYPSLTAANIANFVSTVNATVQPFLTTANVVESPTNLYYTNARARTAFTAADGSIVIDWAAGTIAAAANTSTVVSILNATQRIQSTGANTYTLNVPIATPESILVIVEGLVQIPSVDYTVSGTTLTLSDYPILNSNIEVRYYGTDAIYQSSSIITKVDSFIGTGDTTYTLSLNPPSKDSVTVIVNGVYRQSDQYSINNKVVTFNSAPSIGANVDIRIVAGVAGTAFNTRTYTANGTSNAFVITDGFTKDTILVFANGFARIPTIDYTVINNIVTFTSNVLSIDGQVIQIRELGVTGLVGGTVAAALSGYDLTTGNVIPTIDATKNLGSSTYKWNDSYVNQSYVTNVLILGGTTVSTSGSSITLVSNGVTTTLSGPTQSSRAFGLALIFGG